MTLEKFLKLPKDKQELEVAKFVNPGTWWHDFVEDLGTLDGDYYAQCCKCGMATDSHGSASGLVREVSGLKKTPCTAPDPLKLDWNLAKKLQAKCDRDKFQYGLWLAGNVYPPRDRQREEILDYATYVATPIHYITACMEAKNYFDKEQHNE